jgi:hypothetical protein
MRKSEEEVDIIEELERLDAFYDGTEPGERPIEVLRAKGVEIPDEESLDDGSLHERLWVVIHAMAEIGMYLESTDHLSDRELYRHLVAEALVEETMLPLSPKGAWHLSPIGGCSEEDLEVYYRYYADEEDRRLLAVDGVQLPAHEALPYDRDRLLPQATYGMQPDA